MTDYNDIIGDLKTFNALREGELNYASNLTWLKVVADHLKELDTVESEDAKEASETISESVNRLFQFEMRSDYVNHYLKNSVKTSDMLDLLINLGKIEVKPSEKLSEEQNKQIKEDFENNILNLQLSHIDKFSVEDYHRKFDKEIFKAFQQDIVRKDIARGMKSEYVSKLFKGVEESCGREWYDRTRTWDNLINSSIKDKTLPTEVKQYFKDLRKKMKKFDRKKKIENAGEFVKDHWVVTFVIPAIGILALGGVHHLSHLVSNNFAESRNKVEIERNIEESAEFSKYTCSAILATKNDGKYFVEIFGTGVKNSGNTPEFCSVSYEIGKDLYDTIYKYYDISYEYGRDGQVVNAENIIRDDLGACGDAKARRANWDTMEELVNVTMQDPVSVSWHNPDHVYEVEFENE